MIQRIRQSMGRVLGSLPLRDLPLRAHHEATTMNDLHAPIADYPDYTQVEDPNFGVVHQTRVTREGRTFIVTIGEVKPGVWHIAGINPLTTLIVFESLDAAKAFVEDAVEVE